MSSNDAWIHFKHLFVLLCSEVQNRPFITVSPISGHLDSKQVIREWETPISVATAHYS